jgi:23S rRNA pseudouridine2605 synthase
MAEKKTTGRTRKAESGTKTTTRRKTPDTGFSQKAKPEKKGYYTQTDTPRKKKAFSETGFSQKAKTTVKKGYNSENDSPVKRKKPGSESIGFSQKAKPEKKGYYTQTEKKPLRNKKTPDTQLGERPVSRTRKVSRESETTTLETNTPFVRRTRKIITEEPEKPETEKPEKELKEIRTGRFVRKDKEIPKQPEYKTDEYEKKFSKGKKKTSEPETLIRLNRYIANAGICSRREADTLIEAGEIRVNGVVITEMGYQVKPTDVVKYGSRTLNREKMVYVLLNKPKDFITTTKDPEERKTVMELVKNACPQRIYPVGRLDRTTTGLLLFTNDGELAEKLTHPSYNVKKLYEVEIDKPITKEDFDSILQGVELEDGLTVVDEMAVVNPDRRTLGVQIHSGKNRIVRRIFERFGYDVVKLDRVMYANLTKKDLPRGNWRFLTEKEVITLKYLL